MAASVERMAASRRGSMDGWNVRQVNPYSEERERQTIALRAQDLVANDAYAASAVDSMSLNTVGKGLTPQSQPHFDALRINEEEAQEVANQAEWAWQVWSKKADAAGRMTFGDIQYLNIRSMLVSGEFLNLPVMLKSPSRRYSLALQVIDPLRLRTPLGRTGTALMRDGVELGQHGEALAYWIADPKNGFVTPSLQSWDFKRVPAWLGHRPGCFHEFHQKEPEQVRGVSILAPAMKLFKDLYDYLDYELIGATIAAAFPVVVKMSHPMPGAVPPNGYGNSIKKYEQIKEISPGQVPYLNPGEDMQVLESHRPGGTAEVFIRTVLRAIGAATGQPYEVLAKDFSQTNYSSARAALLEVWRLYSLYRFWLENHFCQPVWAMVFEEAWLRGDIILPKGAPGFYEASDEWTRTLWIGPPRGHVDPVKEMEAIILGLANHILTLSDVVAEQGGDWQDRLRQRSREVSAIKAAGLNSASVLKPNTSKTDKENATEQAA